MVGLLGSGAFATVWRARDDELDSPVAIKVLADNWATRLDVRERFLAEARLLRQADSDRILRVLDIGELPDGRPYFVTVLADGGSLADRLAEGELSTAAALDVVVEVADAVAVLHAMGIVHRDLTPGNVLFHRGRVVVADLGLAKALAQGSGLTLAAGSPGYMAPEQARPDSQVDERTDVYGIGALAHRLLTGVVAADGGPSIGGRLGRAVRRATHPDPDRRWPDVRSFAAELRAVAGGAPDRRPWIRAVTAVVVLAVVAGGILVAWPDPPQAPVVDPSLCRAADLRVVEAGGEDTPPLAMNRRVSSFSLASDRRECTLAGRLEDVRMVLADGAVLPLRFGDGTGAPEPVTLSDGAWAEIALDWDTENRAGAAATPARLEFRLPGSGDPMALEWTHGPVGDGGQMEIGPIAAPVG